MIDQFSAQMARADEQIKALRYDLSAAVREHDEFVKKVEATYVTKIELSPITRLVYGAVSIMLAGLLSALLALVITKGGGQ